MANTNGNTGWEKIQGGVKDTERLIGQRDYNSAMIKARQTLEFMVKQLAERAAIPEGSDLKELIDLLYENQWISKATCEHYHKIRMIGNKAAHEGDQSAYNANQAYHMLSQETYTFANDYSNAQKGSRVKPAAKTAKPAPAGQARKTAAAGKSSPTRRASATQNRSRRRNTGRRGFTVYDILKLLIPVLCIILLFFVVKLFKPGKDEVKETNGQTTTEETMESSSSEALPEDIQENAVVYRTTTNLNVRPEPSTDSERIGQIPGGTTVEYVGAHDSEWAIILYQGQEAYVASQYLTTGYE